MVSDGGVRWTVMISGNWCKTFARPKVLRRRNSFLLLTKADIVCEEWRGSYVVFRDWALANGYEDGLSIERVDVNGDYEPSNCTWIPKNDQQKNRRGVLLVHGKTVQDLCREQGIQDTHDILAIRQRMRKGWNIERALSQPLRKVRRTKHEQ